MSAKGQAWGWRRGRVGKEGSPSQKRVPRPGVPPTPTSRTGPGHGMEGEQPWAGARGLGKVLAGSTEAGKGTAGWGQGGGGGANLAVQPEEDKHDEEEAGPQLGQGHHGHGLGEGDEGQAGACRAHTASGGPTRTHVCTCMYACVCWLSPSTTLGSTLSAHPPIIPSVRLSLLPPLVLGSCSVPSIAPPMLKVS